MGSKIVTLSGYKGYKQLSLKERDRITEMKSEGMRQSQKLWVCSAILLVLMPHGREDTTNRSMVWSGDTSQKARTSVR